MNLLNKACAAILLLLAVPILIALALWDGVWGRR